MNKLKHKLNGFPTYIPLENTAVHSKYVAKRLVHKGSIMRFYYLSSRRFSFAQLQNQDKPGQRINNSTEVLRPSRAGLPGAPHGAWFLVRAQVRAGRKKSRKFRKNLENSQI